MARILCALVSVIVGCAPSSGTPGSGTGRGDVVDPPPMGDAATPPTTDPSTEPPREDCAGVAVAAETELRPVDVVWVVDSSGSMANEAARVQENLNRFADAILMAGLDPHVVMITDSDYVRVPPPLGTDDAHYRFIEQGVGSNAGLARLVSEFPRYGDFLRPEAILHFVAVTDDESGMSVAEFRAAMDLALGGRDYFFHAIASENDGGHECPGAADIGERYYQLAGETMGLTASICTPDWASVFDRLEEHVFASTPIPCELAIPDAPTDLVFDYASVNVEIESPMGGPGLVPNVGDSARCAGDGWYYDDPSAPTLIHLCPVSCDAVNSLHDVRVDVTFGCDTILL